MAEISDHSAMLLRSEARGLLARLDQLRPLALNETMVPAAGLPATASLAMERFLHTGRTLLRRQVHRYLSWLDGPGQLVPAAEQQRHFVVIRMRFNAILSQLDMFTEVVSQRSEHETGVWLAGLDVLAADALRVNSMITDPPPLICYLARGPGAAIRRARTRLPGGDANPIGIIRIPRERMVGMGIASSLAHEVGHQGAALLGLIDSLRAEIRRARRAHGNVAAAWMNWERWISEIVADFWSVATLGIASTLGLFAVVSLPHFFVFRPSGDDPHPVPYIRVLLSAAMGNTLYPDPQWLRITAIWKDLYPIGGLPAQRQEEFALLEDQIRPFAALLAGHRSRAMAGRPLAELFPLAERTPTRLGALHHQWRGDLAAMARESPSLVFAALGQARFNGRLTPEDESQLLSNLLRLWALRQSLALTETNSYRPLRRAS